MDSKLCKKCSIVKPLSEFYYKRTENRTVPYCKSCTNWQTIERQRRLKSVCVAYKGGMCIDCGYNDCLAAFDFHHLDSSKKDFEIGKKKTTKFNQEIMNELDKCVLLCSNCHRKRHAEMVSAPSMYKTGKPWTKKSPSYCDCGMVKLESSKHCKSCENKLRLFNPVNQKIAWPALELLVKKLENTSYTSLARELGVSDNAIRKFLKKRGVNPKTLKFETII